MTPQEFILKFREAFGEAAPLPIAFGTTIRPLMPRAVCLAV